MCIQLHQMVLSPTEDETALQTTIMAQMGESYAVGRAWMATLEKEDRRLKTLDTRITRQGFSVAGNTLDTAYTRHQTRWITRTLMVTVFANMCIVAPAALYRMGTVSSTTAYCMAGVAVVIYAVVLLVIVKNVAYRRRDDWDKYYFRATDIARQAQALTPYTDGGCPAVV